MSTIRVADEIKNFSHDMISSKMAYLLGLDIGTTSIKVALYDPAAGKVINVAARPKRYVLKGGLKAAGSAVEWLARLLSNSDSPDYAGLEKAAADGIGQRAGPLWMPHLIGSGTPQGDRFSRAAMVGALFEHNKGDIFRGLLESLACWLRHNLEEMEFLTGWEIKNVTLTGGAVRLKLLSQLKATLINRSVQVPQLPEAAATGAALLAGLGVGVFQSIEEALSSLHYTGTQIDPILRYVDWYNDLYTSVYLPLHQTLKPVNQTLKQMDH